MPPQPPSPLWSLPGRWVAGFGIAVILISALGLGAGLASAQVPEQLPPAVAVAAADYLAGTTDIPAADWEPLRFSGYTWNDGCLGLGGADEVCTQALVGGWVLWLAAGDTAYRLHTDVDAAQIRLAAGPLTRAEAERESLPEGGQPHITLGGGGGGAPGGLPATGAGGLAPAPALSPDGPDWPWAIAGATLAVLSALGYGARRWLFPLR